MILRKSKRSFVNLIISVMVLIWLCIYVILKKEKLNKEEINIEQLMKLEKISREIDKINKEQKIYNVGKFGPIQSDTFVILIQVHTRKYHLHRLIESLSKVKNIGNSLIIFSHDVFLPELNEVIQSINFARTVQIFYPHSLQLNPTKFPGPSKKDCPRDMAQSEARKIKCENAEWPDVHGHYREADFTQAKHHWWWKVNFVFGKLEVLKSFSGVVTLLEEDHYVAPDFLWMLKLMKAEMVENRCYGCNVLCLGTFSGIDNFRYSSSRVVATQWTASNHNMAVSFNRTIWENIRNCAETFCNVDEYNFDWSLYKTSLDCFELQVMYPSAPRVFHTGQCGTHQNQGPCNPGLITYAIDKEIEQYKEHLFPKSVKVELREPMKIIMDKGNGGWGDLRDRKLCMSFTNI